MHEGFKLSNSKLNYKKKFKNLFEIIFMSRSILEFDYVLFNVLKFRTRITEHIRILKNNKKEKKNTFPHAHTHTHTNMHTPSHSP